MEQVKAAKSEVEMFRDLFYEALVLGPDSMAKLNNSSQVVTTEVMNSDNSLKIKLTALIINQAPCAGEPLIQCPSTAHSCHIHCCAVHKEYSKEKIPLFDGSIRDYKQLKKEWTECVIQNSI